jgi:hypothetical protein
MDNPCQEKINAYFEAVDKLAAIDEKIRKSPHWSESGKLEDMRKAFLAHKELIDRAIDERNKALREILNCTRANN